MTTLDLFLIGIAVTSVPVALAVWLRLTVLENYIDALQRELLHDRVIASMRLRANSPQQTYRWEIDHEHVQ